MRKERPSDPINFNDLQNEISNIRTEMSKQRRQRRESQRKNRTSYILEDDEELLSI